MGAHQRRRWPTVTSAESIAARSSLGRLRRVLHRTRTSVGQKVCDVFYALQTPGDPHVPRCPVFYSSSNLRWQNLLTAPLPHSVRTLEVSLVVQKLTMSPTWLLLFLSAPVLIHDSGDLQLTIKPNCTFFALLLLCFTYSTMAALGTGSGPLLGDAFFGEFTNGGDFWLGGSPEQIHSLGDGETVASSVAVASPTSLRKSTSFLLISYSCSTQGPSVIFSVLSMAFFIIL